MGKIQVLDELITNQIAAGEVVERPSSVVKELVENSVDAGSQRISVSIEEGGLTLIRVTDNGSGIAADDCETAFYRHATSKISSTRDLFQIRSLGFRGEALPSIASVSKIECVTAAGADGLGMRIVVEGGTITALEETAASRGTDIIVRDLFYNTPARLKYMKTIQTELGHISDFLYRLALAHPDIAFTFRHQGKTLMQTLGHGDVLQVVAAIYGATIAKQMVQVRSESLDYELQGWIGKPEVTRANRFGITFIINGRYIRNYALVKAMLNAYHTLLPINRFPIAVIHLRMDPSLLDVNVHPAKLEVRFSKEKELLHFIEQELRKALEQQVLIPRGSGNKEEKKAVIQEQIEFNAVDHSVKAPLQTAAEDTGYELGRQAGKASQPYPERRAQPQSGREQIKEATAHFAPYHSVEQDKPIQQFPQLYPIGQMRGTYILAQNEDGLYLIDQHAAHERIHYEYFYEKFGNPDDVSQELLVPITIEFTPSEAQILQERLVIFMQAGVHLEYFGGNSFLVRAHPQWFPDGEEKEIIEEMAEWILAEKKTIDLAKLREKSAILCSCKAAIKANQSLSLPEMEELLLRLRKAKNPYTCPHGRPIVISFSNYELEKMFKRV